MSSNFVICAFQEEKEDEITIIKNLGKLNKHDFEHGSNFYFTNCWGKQKLEWKWNAESFAGKTNKKIA